MRTFIIIGGGVTGLSTAWHLLTRKAGKVIILEKDFSGAGSSSRAAGITTGLLWTKTGVEVRKLSIRLFEEWSRCFKDYHYHNEYGCLGLFTRDQWPDREKLLPLYDEREVPYEVLSETEIRKRWPVLSPHDLLGLYDPRGGYSEPTQYLPALQQEVIKLGGEIRNGTVATEIRTKGDRVTGVKTNNGDVDGDKVICTTYAWTNLLTQQLGIFLPVKSFIHQRYVSKPLSAPLEIPAINADSFSGYIRPAEGNRFLMGIESADTPNQDVENFEFQESILPGRWELVPPIQKKFGTLLPLIADVEWDYAKVGLINFSQDGDPILGPVPGYNGLYIGLAFHSGGFSYSPASGLLLAELADTETTSICIDEFNPGRFSDQAVNKDYLASSRTQKTAHRRRH